MVRVLIFLALCKKTNYNILLSFMGKLAWILILIKEEKDQITRTVTKDKLHNGK